MPEFQKNDRVRVLPGVPTYSGREGEILGVAEDVGFYNNSIQGRYLVLLDDDTEELVFQASEIELLKGDNSITAIDPNHYKFGGAQVIDITRHMGFLEGNVVKYVARAGRKGDKLEDLLKAKKYLEWAIEDAQR